LTTQNNPPPPKKKEKVQRKRNSPQSHRDQLNVAIAGTYYLLMASMAHVQFEATAWSAHDEPCGIMLLRSIPHKVLPWHWHQRQKKGY
jgi:hypothetical protein